METTKFLSHSANRFFEKVARRLITIYHDEPSYPNTSELLKAFCVCVWACVSVHVCARAYGVKCFCKWLIISDTKKFYLDDNESDESFIRVTNKKV